MDRHPESGPALPPAGAFNMPSSKAGLHLRKQALLAGTAAAPLGPTMGVTAVPEEPDADSPSSSAARKPTPMGPPRPGRPQVAPRQWDEYWDACEDMELPSRGRFRVYSAGSAGPVVLCLHGGGYTGLTWSLVATQLKEKCRVVAPDLRGHGGTSTADDLDLSKGTMTADVVALWTALFGNSQQRTPTLLVGHSMGGALAVWAAVTRSISGLDGVAVVDVVEGTAIAALPHMMGILSSRPSSFPSLQAALDWALRSGMCKLPEAAGVSLPSQLQQEGGGWRWRTPLAASQPYWQGWYSGLSEAYLQLPVPKLLLLAGTDRLDKALTIGQMQGRFQLVLLPAAGHAVQEDEPNRTSEALQGFVARFRIGQPSLLPPRAAPGVAPVLPIVAGPLHVPPPPSGTHAPGAGGGQPAGTGEEG